MSGRFPLGSGSRRAAHKRRTCWIICDVAGREPAKDGLPNSACATGGARAECSAKPGVALGVSTLDAVADMRGGRHGVTHDIHCVAQIAVHLRHAVAVALVLLLSTQGPDSVRSPLLGILGGSCMQDFALGILLLTDSSGQYCCKLPQDT